MKVVLVVVVVVVMMSLQISIPRVAYKYPNSNNNNNNRILLRQDLRGCLGLRISCRPLPCGQWRQHQLAVPAARSGCCRSPLVVAVAHPWPPLPLVLAHQNLLTCGLSQQQRVGTHCKRHCILCRGLIFREVLNSSKGIIVVEGVLCSWVLC